MSELERLIKRGEALLERVEGLLPPASRPVDWQASTAFRWRRTSRAGFIQPVTNIHRIRLSDLRGIDSQKALIEQNTLQFVEGRTANNALLTGARGTGKSSRTGDRKSTRLNSSHRCISYAVFCLKKKKKKKTQKNKTQKTENTNTQRQN